MAKKQKKKSKSARKTAKTKRKAVKTTRKATAKRSASQTGGKKMGETNTCKPCPAMCVLRVTLGFVFLYASLTKLFFGSAPPVDAIITFIPADISLFFMGLVEFVIGVLLLLGLFTRVAGWMATAVFGLIFVATLYLEASGAVPGVWNIAMMFKDVGLAGAAIALGLNGSMCCSLDAWIKKRASK